MFYFRTITVNPPIPEPIGRLHELAYNLWFSWNRPVRKLFQEINPGLWDQVEHNPVKFLLQVKREDLEQVARREDYIARYKDVLAEYDRYHSSPKWFSQNHPDFKEKVIAYFSAEFGLHESLPIYSGGLGILAGDHIKSASDLGLPLVGVGLLYKNGYFNQVVDREGRQRAIYPRLNFSEMPCTALVGDSGLDITVSVEFPGRTVFMRVWEIKVGLVSILLLDTDLPINMPEDRQITGRLYGGGTETRIAQEMVLGVGGVKALRALGLAPAIWHINEGHAAFLTLERLREFLREGISPGTAKEAIRSNTLFTTHTPVPAGHDVFSRELVENYLHPLCRDTGLSSGDLMELGWDDQNHQFNMTLLAMRMSGYCNGVSRLHGEVTRQMFQRFYPGVPVHEVPVTSVTNGVHSKSWIEEEWKKVFSRYVSPGWMEQITDATLWQRVTEIPDQVIWETHQLLKKRAINFIRGKVREKRQRNYDTAAHIEEAAELLDPNALTIGFARRFATYKRATLLFRDLERLSAILNHRERPVQIVFAGKAHPADAEGQSLIRQIMAFTRQKQFRGKVVFLENYNINVARHLLYGVDIWLNTPRWPMEASGTSGMKAAMNGVLHCSVLDGWWPEGYNGNNGFAIGAPGYSGLDSREQEQDQDQDDAYYLYSLLEDKVVPLYYQRQEGLPRQWIEMMRESFRTIIPQFSAARMVSEYADRLYLPAIKRGIAFLESGCMVAEKAGRFKRYMEDNWHHVRVERINSHHPGELRAGQELVVESVVRLGPIPTEEVVVELAYGRNQGDYLGAMNTRTMNMKERVGEGKYLYQGKLPLVQGSYGYTVRVRPLDALWAEKFEVPLVKWADTF